MIADKLLSFLFFRRSGSPCLGRTESRDWCALFIILLIWFQAAAQHHRDSPQLITANQVQTQKEPSGPAKITSLKVRIITKNNRGAGTDNAVYFDIGPLGWKLDTSQYNDFEGGSDTNYRLKFPAGLTTADILWLRLHKKGLAGVTGTKDGFDGAWHPERITLVVNDAEYRTVAIDQPLNSRCWYWRSEKPDDSDLDLFAHSLRILPNEKLNLLDKASGILTTNLFKRRGISGWLSNPAKKECTATNHRNTPAQSLRPMCVTGEVIARGRSTDDMETIDLKVAKLESCQAGNRACLETVILNVANGFESARYIRVENHQGHSRVHTGEMARICGNVLWDTDHEGWWEVHPRSRRDLPPLSKLGKLMNGVIEKP